MNSTPRRADSQRRNVAATTGQGRQTHRIPHRAGKENKQQAHTPARLTPATLPTHASPATARTPMTASASNSSVGPPRVLQETSSHGKKAPERGSRATWCVVRGCEEPSAGLEVTTCQSGNRELRGSLGREFPCLFLQEKGRTQH